MFKKINSILLTITFVFFATISSSFAACDSGERVVKLSHVTGGTTHPKVVAANNFAERVNKELNGKLCVEVYPNSTLFGDSKELEALLLDDVQMLAPSLSKFGSYTKKYGVFDLPFIFKDMDAAMSFTASKEGKDLLNAMEDVGFVGLGYWMSGMKYFSANKALISPTDAKGLKFRVQTSDVAKAMIAAMGASPQPMAFSEVYGALQTGVVDGPENTWSNIFGHKFFEVQDGVTETDHGVIDYLVGTSTDFWDGLPSDVRDQLATILTEVTEARNGESTAVNAAAKQAILDAGGVVRTLNADQRAAWVEAMLPVWGQFVDGVGQDNIDAAQ